MKSIAKLKEQARLHEQKEEWEKAILAYEQALRLSEEGPGEAELQLFNRIGDLHLRRGRQADAVRCYEQAADRYAEAGFYNNAIALCNKALRYSPNRAELYRKLGRYSGAQGFITDARRYFLEYAERMQRAGELAEAFRALEELADLGDDPELREMLAQQLARHGETALAVQQLQRAYALRLAAGDGAAAESVKQRILELDPGAEVSASSAAARAPGAGDGGSAQLPGLDLQSTAGAAGIDARAAVPGRSSGVGSGPPHDDYDGALELPTLDDPEPDEAPEPLPLLDGDGARTGGGPPPTIDVNAFDLTLDAPVDAAVEPALDAMPDLSIALDGMDGDAGIGDGDGAVDVGVAGDGLEDARPELDVGLDRALAAAAAGREADALAELGALRDRLHDDGALERALTVLEELVGRSPGSMAAHQMRVELATRAADPGHLVEAYLGLAACLSAAGARAKAAAVFEQVLSMDPSNERARAGLAEVGGAGRAPTAARPAAAAREEYVDLGALVADDLMGELTDGQGAVGAGAGEDADFTELLSQYKSKATERTEADDPGSHYDLGLAFKEMGLIDEAIVEFQKALGGGAEQLKIYEELGQCFMLKEQYDLAGKILSRALKVPRTDDRELLGVYYHLGRCYEELGQREAARDAFERVVDLGGIFRDVAERLARL